MAEYDLCIIGAGPGGIAAAIEASSLGAKVLVIEKDDVGGICLNKGCIPTKAYIKSALFYSESKRSDALGISCRDVSYDLSQIKRHAGEVVARLKNQIESAFKSKKIDLIKGKATFLDAESIVVGEKKIKARSFIIATGSVPKDLSSFAVDNKRVFCSEGILEIKNVAKDITIIGAGPIGCEFASFFSALGTEVTIIEMLERILPKEDEEISNRLEGIFKKKGIKILTSHSPLGINEIKTEAILISVGRIANISSLGLDKAGVQTRDSAIVVDEYLETNKTGIFAIGDCVGRYNLAHIASAEGRVASRNALGVKTKMDYTLVPSCVYSFPEVASVGLSKDEALKRGLDVQVGRTHFLSLGRAQAQEETEGFIKLIIDKKSKTILGAQILGDCATELIGAISIAIRGKLKAEDLAEVIQAHPTFSEGIQEAALGLLRQGI